MFFLVLKRKEIFRHKNTFNKNILLLVNYFLLLMKIYSYGNGENYRKNSTISQSQRLYL